MPRRRKSPNTVPTPRRVVPAPLPQESTAGPQGLTTSTLHLVEPLLTMLVNAGVTDFQGFGVSVRLGHRPAVERRTLVPVPAMRPLGLAGAPEADPAVHPGGLAQGGGPLTPEAREALLSRLEGAGVDEDSPLFDAVRRSSS